MNKKHGGALLGLGQSGCVFDDETPLACESVELNPYKRYAVKLTNKSNAIAQEAKIAEVLAGAERNVGVPQNTFFVGVDAYCEVDSSKVSEAKSICETKRRKKLNNRLMISFTPLVENGVIYEEMKWDELGFNDIINIWVHLVTGLGLMFHADVIHYDIKGDNIMFDMNNVLEPKFIDFGQSQRRSAWLDEPNEELRNQVLSSDGRNFYEMVSHSHFMQYKSYKKAFDHAHRWLKDLESSKPDFERVIRHLQAEGEKLSRSIGGSRRSRRSRW